MNVFFDTRKGGVLVDSIWLSALLAEGSGKDAAFTGSLSILNPSSGGKQNILTVTAISSGTIYQNTKLVGAGVQAGTHITGQLSGTPGGIGVYTVDIGQTVGSESMTSTALADLAAGSLTLSGSATVAGETTTQSLQLDTGVKTATAVAGAATLNKSSGVITSEALTTVPGATYSLNISNTDAQAGDMAFASVANGTNAAGVPAVATVTVTNGHIVIVVQNIAAAGNFNGTLAISYMLIKSS